MGILGKFAAYDINLASDYYWKAIEDFRYESICN
jgi:hypothetical protein